MCGIAGTYGIKSRTLALKYLKTLRHRGPDEGPRVVRAKKASIGAVRLSIVDVKNGHQPMIEKGTGNVVASNGEIYNYKELKSELETLGYIFNSDCDTEVLLHGFSRFGPKFVEKLNGIFAIAFYRAKDETLFLFRDLFGVKPLHYVATKRTLRFASEIKALFSERDSYKLDIDFIVFNKIFGCSLPERSLYQKIKSVVPGTYIKFNGNNAKSTKYHSTVAYSKPNSWIDAKETLVKELSHAVTQQIPSEVEWGVLLSGGVDSSILSWLAQKNYNKRIQTYSVCSSETETEDFINARRVAKQIKSKHNEILVKSENAFKDFPDYLLTIEDINSRFLFYYYLAKAMKGKVKVGLCGEGSDELFAGYPVYRNITEYVSTITEKFNKYKSYLSPSTRRKVANLVKKIKTGKIENLYNFMIIYQMPYFQLNPVDKCSMRFGIELRVPYLSLNNALLAMNLPKNWLLKGNIEKKLLRDSFEKTNLASLQRKKVFAGTRTLPAFYKRLHEESDKAYPILKNKYKTFSKILDPQDLYCLNILDTGMRKVGQKEYGRTN